MWHADDTDRVEYGDVRIAHAYKYAPQPANMDVRCAFHVVLKRTFLALHKEY